MPSVNSVNGLDTSLYADDVNKSERSNRVSGTDSSIPSASDTGLQDILKELDLPPLPVSLRGIQIDQLMLAVSNESRRNQVTLAVDSIGVHGDEIKAENDKKLELIKEEVAKLEKESFWNKFCKAFKIIGLVVGAIASVATTIVGGITGNPALIAAGVIGIVMTVDGIVSLASDGKYSIAAGFTELGKKMGMSDEAAKWFGFGMNLAIVITAMALSFGASAAMSGTKVVDSANVALSAIAKVGAFSNIGSGIANAGSATAQIGLAVVQYSLANIRADKVDIDAILADLQNNIKINEELIQVQMDASEDIMNDVKDIVDNCENAANSILVASPSVA